MKIQIISEYFYPDNFRINDIVRNLTESGHTVQVLTALPDYATGRIPDKYRRHKNRKEDYCGAFVRRIGAAERKTGTLQRILNYGTFMINSAVYACFCKKPDVDSIFVYETSPIFQALPGIILKKRLRKKLTLYCCDLWPESLKAWGIKEDSFVFKVVRKYSSWLYRKCDTVAITSKPFRDYLINVCKVENEKIVYLPQHFEDDFKDIACQYEENGTVDFLFAGNIGAVQSLDTLIRAAALMKTDKPFKIHLVGDGSECENLKALSQQLHTEDRIIFHGRHPGSEMPAFYKMADCLILTLRGGDAIGLTLPAKAQGYLCAGKPIAGAIDGAGYEMIHEAQCGGAVHAGDAEGFARLLSSIADEFDVYKQCGENGRKFYEQNYTKDIFMQSLLKIL